jgi:hypothetical protein
MHVMETTAPTTYLVVHFPLNVSSQLFTVQSGKKYICRRKPNYKSFLIYQPNSAKGRE